MTLILDKRGKILGWVTIGHLPIDWFDWWLKDYRVTFNNVKVRIYDILFVWIFKYFRKFINTFTIQNFYFNQKKITYLYTTLLTYLIVLNY